MRQALSQPTQHFSHMTEKDQVFENYYRCGGMLVDDRCYDLTSSGIFKIATKRCIQCGDVIDPVILQHRRHSRLSEAYAS